MIITSVAQIWVANCMFIGFRLKGSLKENSNLNRGQKKLPHPQTGWNPTSWKIITESLFQISGLLRHWQEMLHLIVKRLQFSECLSKLILDIQTLESNLREISGNPVQSMTSSSDHVTSSEVHEMSLAVSPLILNPSPNVIHNKNDLEREIQGLKVRHICYILSNFCPT